jgi:heat shock protein HslJ
MRSILLLVVIALLFSYCGSSHKSGSATTKSRKGRSGSSDNKAADSVVVTGSQFIPIYGRSETGVQPDLEGSWELESMEGYKWEVDVIKKLDSIAAAKMINEKTNQIRYSDDTAKEVRITPPQGSSYHIPQKPTISFYGLNETFSGFTGCNKYSGRYSMPDSTTLNLKAAMPSTKMVCLVEPVEKVFLDNIRSVNTFKGTSVRLELMSGDKVIMVFRRKSEQK